MQKSVETEKEWVYHLAQIFSAHVWPRDLYITFSTRGLKLPDHIKSAARKDFCARIFVDVFLKIIEDIITYNLTFRFPLDERRWAHLSMHKISGDHFEKLVRGGYLPDLDPLEAGFKTYKMFMTYPTNSGMKKKKVYLGKDFNKLIIERQKHGTCYD